MPMSTSGMAEITLETDAHLRVELVDVLGNVTVLTNEFAPAQLRVLTLPISELSQGWYTLRATINNVVYNTTVVVNR